MTEKRRVTFEVKDGDVRLGLEIAGAGPIAKATRDRIQGILEEAFYGALYENLQKLGIVEVVPKVITR